ncbi:MAG: nicotinate phosphoribosyltransferase [Chloroflexia bacterium]|nr:nicotinate phosphoribosyltransferase [Chloroflexia bacterium]MDQ3412282.1 nicotinate phosphoribosyltransferase [Chloroflexota bacterium]
MWSRGSSSTGLAVDLYHIDSAYVSWRTMQNGVATFDLYTRSNPFGGAYQLVAGLEQALEFVANFRYTQDDLDYLATIKPYDPDFLHDLGRLRFTGDMLAMAEGTIAFAPEPLLQVTAPFREALLLEAGLLHAIGRATLIATKASRVVHAARGRPIAEFSLRRAAEPFVVARSAAIAGCQSTSFLEAARAYGLRGTATIPHALIQAFPTEEAAFRAVAATLNQYTLLLDTYEVRRSVKTAVAVAREARTEWGHTLLAVRLDSGDLTGNSHYVRQVLDEAGLPEVQILASGDMDEFTIDLLLRQQAPIDGFGVGTSIGVAAGSIEHGIEGGALGAVYKLVWYVERPDSNNSARIKLARAKSTWPGRKQVYRFGPFAEDLIQGEHEPAPAGAVPLLQPMMRDGAIVPGAIRPIPEIQELAAASFAALPAPYQAIEQAPIYPVRWSDGLIAMRQTASEVAWQG